MYARLRPNRSPILLPIRMNAAETSASRAMADWTLLAVVCRSCTTAEIETFISDVSTTSTNIAIARRIETKPSPLDASTGAARTATESPARSMLPHPWERVRPVLLDARHVCSVPDLCKCRRRQPPFVEQPLQPVSRVERGRHHDDHRLRARG